MWSKRMHRGKTKFSTTFQSLIMRLIYPVTYVTILSYDLLSSWADGKIGPKRDEQAGDHLKAANQHACVIWLVLDCGNHNFSVFIKLAIWVKLRVISVKQSINWIKSCPRLLPFNKRDSKKHMSMDWPVDYSHKVCLRLHV